MSSTSISVVLSAGSGLEDDDSGEEDDESERVLEDDEKSRRMSSTPLIMFPHWSLPPT